MKTPLLFPALLAAAMLGGLILALFGDEVWDFVAYLLIVPSVVLASLVATRAARALAKSTEVPPAEASPSPKED